MALRFTTYPFTRGPLAQARVVSLIASSTEMIHALGCGDRLVGRSHECDFPLEVRKLPAVTAPKFPTDVGSGEIDRSVRALVEQAVSVYRVDAQALDALRPDLIVTQVQCEVCAVSLRDVEAAVCELVTSRPRIVALESNALSDIWRDLRKVADALGVPERGVQQVTRLSGRMRAVAGRAASLTPRPRVACLEWIEPLMAAGHWTPELVAMAGADDLFGTAGGRSPVIEWEALRAADPDVLFVLPCGFDLARTRREMGSLVARPGWNDLRAVRTGQVILGDGNAYFNRPGPRVAEALEILAEVLHPEAFRFGHECTGWARFAS